MCATPSVYQKVAFLCEDIPFQALYGQFVNHTTDITVIVKFDTANTAAYVTKGNTFHFHMPSEHTINGQSYPLEAHFVTYPAPIEEW